MRVLLWIHVRNALDAHAWQYEAHRVYEIHTLYVQPFARVIRDVLCAVRV